MATQSTKYVCRQGHNSEHIYYTILVHQYNHNSRSDVFLLNNIHKQCNDRYRLTFLRDVTH